MPRHFAITGERTRRLKRSLHTGSPEKKGGLGLKRTGVHTCSQKPNLVKKTLWLGGKPRRVYLSVKALHAYLEAFQPSRVEAPSGPTEIVFIGRNLPTGELRAMLDGCVARAPQHV
jgi:hypothetical protein